MMPAKRGQLFWGEEGAGEVAVFQPNKNTKDPSLATIQRIL
jgi:hypothetical protein